MGFLGEVWAAVDPEVKREASKLLGRSLASAAHPCAVPGCTLRSAPGLVCECGAHMCIEHATGMLRPTPHVKCIDCILKRLGLAEQVAADRAARADRKARRGKRVR